MAGSHTAVDGVPVLLAPTGGTMRAGLMFRVGRADETLTTGGISHLVEHLALFRHGTADYHYNGATGLTTTQFVIQGSPDDVVAFLNGVCASLRDLPIERLATEKKLLQAEAATRSAAVNGETALWRHGSRGYGLSSYPEFGTHTLTADTVLAWAATRFNRDNAVLWIAGDEVPPGLQLDLPTGDRYPLPAATSALPVTPAYFNSGSPMIVMDTRVPRNRAAVLYAKALERALFRRLRQEGGLSYLTAAAYDTVGDVTATVTAVADALPDQHAAVVEGFTSVIATLATGELHQAELDTIRSMELDDLRQPESGARLLQRRATDLLTGFPSTITADLIDGFGKVTTAEVREVAETARSAALLMVPHGYTLEHKGFEAAPTLSRFAITGTRHRSRTSPATAIVRGADGLSLSSPIGAATVLYRECTAVLRFPDGARHFFGADAMNVRVEPNLFTISPVVLAELDRAVSPGLIVDMPARDAESIPTLTASTVARRRLRSAITSVTTRFQRHAPRTYPQQLLLYRAAVIIAVSGISGTVIIMDFSSLLLLMTITGGLSLLVRR